MKRVRLSMMLRLSFLSFFFFSSRRRHTRCSRDWSSDVCSSDLTERIDSSFRAPNKDAPSRHRGLCLGAQDAGKTEGPLQLEFRHLLGRELRHLCGLKTELPEVHAPAVPVRLRERIRKEIGRAHV